MKALAAAEVLVEQNVSRFPGTREWLFKHALVREVAYASLGERECNELHALAAEWLASMGEDAATIAGHYDLGGKHVAAAEHWSRAAARSLATNALADAVSMAERALGFAEDKPSAFLRACYLDEAWSRIDPRAAERETAIRALEESVYDQASAVRTRGARARYDDARGTGAGSAIAWRKPVTRRQRSECTTRKRVRRRRSRCGWRSRDALPTPRPKRPDCSSWPKNARSARPRSTPGRHSRSSAKPRARSALRSTPGAARLAPLGPRA
jgi:hypothetical protein